MTWPPSGLPSLLPRWYVGRILPPSNRYGVQSMEAGEEGDREESCGSCRHKATVYCRAQIWIYDHGKWRVLHWAWGTVEILLGPFSSSLVLFPHSLYCTLHSSEDKSTAPTITLSQAFNFLLHPYSSAANQSINLHAWWNMSHDLQISRRFHTRPTWSRRDIRASSQRFFSPAFVNYSDKPSEKNVIRFIYYVVLGEKY